MSEVRDARRVRLKAMAAEYRKYVAQLRASPGADGVGAPAIRRFEEVAADLEFAATLIGYAPNSVLKCARLGIQPEEAGL